MIKENGTKRTPYANLESRKKVKLKNIKLFKIFLVKFEWKKLRTKNKH